MGAASALDWLGRLGQGSNRGFSAKRAVAPFAHKAGTSDFKVEELLAAAPALCFMVGTILGGTAAPLLAQVPRQLRRSNGARAAAAPATTRPAPSTAPLRRRPAERTIRSITVKGNQRLEPETIRAYANLAPGQTYTAAMLDQALKDLYATQLFADVVISGAETGDLVINVRENPVINRIILEGNKRLKDDKITPEIKLAPRQIFTRIAVRADVDRILELYRRQGRFAARVDPKIVQLDQNRVDVVFEIYEGDLAKVRAINILGNDAFHDGRLLQGDVHQAGRRGSRLPEVE